MKKILLLGAALFMSTAAFSATYVVVGANVNGSEDWDAAGTNVMTQVSENTYEWTGTQLGTKFKITENGTWDNAIGAGSNGTISLGVPYSYEQGSSTQDINIVGNNCAYVENPKLVLDTQAKTLVLTGTAVAKEPVEPGTVTYYIIGSNVNGASWALAAEDAKFEDLGNGIYEWKGNLLGTGFKINDGTWSNDDLNYGAYTGVELTLGVPYDLNVGGGSGNIAFAGGFTEVVNPTVTLDINNMQITVTGNQQGEAKWYVAGINGIYELTSDWELAPVEGKEGVYGRDVYIVETAGVFKISDDGWAHQLGTNFPEEVFIDPSNLTVQVEPVDGEGGDINYELEEGTWYVEFDYNEYVVTFKSGSGVSAVFGNVESDAVYYNLQGMRVNNPERGIFVKVQNGQAVKIVK